MIKIENNAVTNKILAPIITHGKLENKCAFLITACDTVEGNRKNKIEDISKQIKLINLVFFPIYFSKNKTTLEASMVINKTKPNKLKFKIQTPLVCFPNIISYPVDSCKTILSLRYSPQLKNNKTKH